MSEDTVERKRVRLIVKKIPLTLVYNNPDGVEEEIDCDLCELTGDERDAYLNLVTSRTKQNGDGTATIKDFKGLQAALLEKSLRKPDGKKFTAPEVQKWCSSGQGELAKMARELSRLEEDAEVVEGEP